MLDIYYELKLIVQDFEKENVAYALCGGLAVAYYGYVRATTDIDFVISDKSLDKAISIIKSHGFIIEAKPMSFSKSSLNIHRFIKIEKKSGDYIPVDLLVHQKQNEKLLQASKKFQLDNILMKVVSKEDLIYLKKMRNNHQDKQDIEKLGEK